MRESGDATHKAFWEANQDLQKLRKMTEEREKSAKPESMTNEEKKMYETVKEKLGKTAKENKHDKGGGKGAGKRRLSHHYTAPRNFNAHNFQVPVVPPVMPQWPPPPAPPPTGGKGGGTGFRGQCNKCRQFGHMARDCRN